jgi:hypothetical protein
MQLWYENEKAGFGWICRYELDGGFSGEGRTGWEKEGRKAETLKLND